MIIIYVKEVNEYVAQYDFWNGTIWVRRSVWGNTHFEALQNMIKIIKI